MNEMIIQAGDDCDLLGCGLGCTVGCGLNPALIAIGVSAYDQFSD